MCLRNCKLSYEPVDKKNMDFFLHNDLFLISISNMDMKFETYSEIVEKFINKRVFPDICMEKYLHRKYYYLERAKKTKLK